MTTTPFEPSPAMTRLHGARSIAGQIERRWRGRRAYGVTAGAIAAVTLPMFAVRDSLGVLNVALIYLLLVFAVALIAGSRPASVAAVVSFVILDLIFIPPVDTFTIARSDHVLALFVYLGIAFITGQLVARVRARTEIALREQRRTALLYDLNAALIAGVTLDQILSRIVERVVTVYGAAVSYLLIPDEDDRLIVRAAYPPGRFTQPDRQQLAIAAWAIEHRAPAGRSSAGRRIWAPHGPGANAGPVVRRETDLLYLPVATADRVVGVLGVVGRPGGGRFDAEDEALLASFANQAALALERARLSEEAARAEALARSDELKSALLSAVSHDLRTPLAAIKASATALLDRSVEWDEAARREFFGAIDEETDRLTMMVENLLDLSRIEGGALRPDREWYDVAELINDVERRLRARAVGHPISTDLPADLPLLWLDYVEIAQVLMNLGENAIKYTSPGTPITLSARAVDGAVEFSVRDQGPGLPAGQAARLFDKFYRGPQSGRVPGTGIGLTISRGLVEAHGGRIWVESSPGAGTAVRFTVPLPDGASHGG